MAKSSTKNSVKGPESSTWKKRLIDVVPFTPAQADFFSHYDKQFNLILSGSAGCGKTFIALYKALEESKNVQYRKKIVIVRSVVPTRDMGFLPGTQREKEEAYVLPYVSVVNSLYGTSDAWDTLVSKGIIEFMTTSYIRGITLSDSIVIVDEMQNCNFHELDSIITRIGDNSRIIFAGDYYQSDFTRNSEKQGINKFIGILEKMNYFHHIKFTYLDICRSGIVFDYIMTKEMEEAQENKEF